MNRRGVVAALIDAAITVVTLVTVGMVVWLLWSAAARAAKPIPMTYAQVLDVVFACKNPAEIRPRNASG